MNATSLASIQQQTAAKDSKQATPAMDPLYKTQCFSAALKLAAGRDEGVFQFSGVYVPTLILDAATRICYLRSDENLAASHASESVSVRQLKAIPEWVQRGRMLRLDAVLADHRALIAQQHNASVENAQNIKAQVEHGLLGFLRRPIFGGHAH